MAAFSKPRGLLPMLFALLVLLQVTVALHGHQHAHRSPKELDAKLNEIRDMVNERSEELEKRQNGGTIEITGVRRAYGESILPAAPRLEIRQLYQNRDMFNLYILGLERFYSKARNDPMGYYQVAGVHGRPFITWNNFGPLVNQAGFCPHSQGLFPTWHRPYLAVFEQAWYNCVKEIIHEHSGSRRDQLANAARTLRMPYWDWAIYPGNNQPAVPDFVRSQQITVTRASGWTGSINNPLYSYSWGNSLPSEMGGGPWDGFPTTLRRPVSNPTRSNNNEMNDRFRSIRASLADRIYDLFMASRSGASFGFVSTSQIGVRTEANGNNPDSFESVHDAVHVTAGGESGGHMWFLDYSSFDPIFWLHHFNVDRLLAMYQTVSPNTYVATTRINRGMAQWNEGEEKNANTPLKPFTKDTRGNFFTSNDVKDTRSLNYYYNDASGDVLGYVTNNYGPNSQSQRNRKRGEPAERQPLRDGDYNTVLSVQASKYQLDGSYAIHCFLGGAGNSTAPYANTTSPYSNSTAPYSNSTAPYSNSTSGSYDFTLDPNYVGMYAVMGGSKAGNSSSPVITEGSLPLTRCLQGKEYAGELKSLKPEHVTPYLAKHLSYKVIGPGNVEIPADQIPHLHISVKSCKVTVPNGEKYPVYGDYEKLPEATINKPAGKPFTYTPTPLDYAEPGEGDKGSNKPTLPTKPAVPAPSKGYPGVSYPPGGILFPDQEPGYCISKQTIKYVDPEGQFLYEQTS
ncbi:hypothetical protein B0J11DRAFT_8188 [Dendryphion nanum]|uniref:tyrosinase n=1 Tax=Dendryphion nanum TaxID=256645 RepID=A0A9P9EIM9_9PLEO|nr:hypothetical protein B0J11DRAFT_8188 [Dendryphion nanum]